VSSVKMKKPILPLLVAGMCSFLIKCFYPLSLTDAFFCSHLAICRHCSDLIMTSSRQCPLCRTRIAMAPPLGIY
jgi:hypothetical protein